MSILGIVSRPSLHEDYVFPEAVHNGDDFSNFDRKAFIPGGSDEMAGQLSIDEPFLAEPKSGIAAKGRRRVGWRI